MSMDRQTAKTNPGSLDRDCLKKAGPTTLFESNILLMEKNPAPVEVGSFIP